jgi:hypothetical protein
MLRFHILTANSHTEPKSLSGSAMASDRLRLWPIAYAAESKGAHVTIGDSIPPATNIVVVGKIGENAVRSLGSTWLKQIQNAKSNGCRVFVDYTDHHLINSNLMTIFYEKLLSIGVEYTVPNLYLASELQKFSIERKYTHVIEDLCEYSILRPTSSKSEVTSVLWFGHPSNILPLAVTLDNWPKTKKKVELSIVSTRAAVNVLQNYAYTNTPNISFNFTEWSVQSVYQLAKTSDFAIIPIDRGSSKNFVSNNRLVTALQLGLPVIATSVPSYQQFSEYFRDLDNFSLGQIIDNPEIEHEKVLNFQENISERFSLQHVTKNWAQIFNI